MNNPANMLIDLFENWKRNKGSDNIFSHDSALQIAIQGGVLIKELSDFLESTKGTTPDLTFYIPKLTEWAEVVGKVSTKQTVFDGEIDSSVFSLRTLAPHFDKLSSVSTEEDAASVAESVDELTRVITSDPTFPDDLKRYCFKIFEAVRHDLAMFESLNEFDLQESIDRLIAATSHVAKYYQGDESKTQKLSQLFNRLIGFGRFSKSSLEALDSGTSVFSALNPGL